MESLSINLNPKVPSIPSFTDKTKIDARYMVIAPYVSIHVYWDTKAGEFFYFVD